MVALKEREKERERERGRERSWDPNLFLKDTPPMTYFLQGGPPLKFPHPAIPLSPGDQAFNI
jgi:hypothetical protein